MRFSKTFGIAEFAVDRGLWTVDCFKKNYKPVSRILYPFKKGGYHLSGRCITATILLPTLQHRASSPQTLIYVALQHTRFTQMYCYQYNS